MADAKTLGDWAQNLAALKNTDAWRVLGELVAERTVAVDKRAVARYRSPDEISDFQRGFDAGFLAGAKWLLDNPDRIQRDFDAAVRHGRFEKEGDSV